MNIHEIRNKNLYDLNEQELRIRCAYDTISNYIDKLREGNEELKEKLHEKNMQIIKLNELLGGKDG